ncbi:signal peptidase I [Pedobacter foliorum]|uniref:signal peptidase I n=1 Tax=Pedobacter foliorum TaxID=2739058 RepID=UPI0015664343|nr:signal peptidase I [Pedobacter foliorum]NRF38562.1 signal peptidase I [Pedobacter foliorum]
MSAGVFKILAMLFAIILFRLFIGEPLHVPSPSMEPSIHVGDWIWVNKHSYGAVIPARYSDIPFINILTWIPAVNEKDKKRDWGFHRFYSNLKPKVNDVVIFNSPDKVGTLLIKRIAKIIRKGSTIVVNSQNLERYNGILESELGDEGIQVLQEKIRNNLATNINLRCSYYFLLGDNKALSLDSRSYGYIPERDIIGKVNFIIINFSFDDLRKIRFLKTI